MSLTQPQEAAVLLLVQSSLMTLISEPLCFSATGTLAIHPSDQVRHYIDQILSQQGPATRVSLPAIAA